MLPEIIQNAYRKSFKIFTGNPTLRPTPASSFSVFLSGIRKFKNVFQVTQYKTCQILVQTFPEPWARGSTSVFHFRKRVRFQVPGFEWVHELLLFCLASNPAQFCAEISCGKTGLGHNCTDSSLVFAETRGSAVIAFRRNHLRVSPIG